MAYKVKPINIIINVSNGLINVKKIIIPDIISASVKRVLKCTSALPYTAASCIILLIKIDELFSTWKR